MQICDDWHHAWDPCMVLKLTMDELKTRNGKTTIEDLFTRWMRVEVLKSDNQVVCPKCEIPRVTLKKVEITSAPPVLVTQIKRFKHSNGKTTKLEDQQCERM